MRNAEVDLILLDDDKVEDNIGEGGCTGKHLMRRRDRVQQSQDNYDDDEAWV